MALFGRATGRDWKLVDSMTVMLVKRRRCSISFRVKEENRGRDVRQRWKERECWFMREAIHHVSLWIPPARRDFLVISVSCANSYATLATWRASYLWPFLHVQLYLSSKRKKSFKHPKTNSNFLKKRWIEELLIWRNFCVGPSTPRRRTRRGDAVFIDIRTE